MYSVWRFEATLYAKGDASTMPDDKHDDPSDVEPYYDEKEDDDYDSDDDDDDDTDDDNDDDNVMQHTIVRDFGALANPMM